LGRAEKSVHLHVPLLFVLRPWPNDNCIYIQHQVPGSGVEQFLSQRLYAANHGTQAVAACHAQVRQQV